MQKPISRDFFKPPPRTKLGRWSQRIRRLLRHALSLRLLELSRRLGHDLLIHYRRAYDIHQMLGIPGASRVDWQKADEKGTCRVEWTAIDPFKRNSMNGNRAVLPVRDHMMRLFVVTCEVGDIGRNGWFAVASNLHLACSLEDLFAYTDVTGSSLMCSDAAEYDAADSDLAVKHLTGVIIFTLGWSPYEAAIEVAGNVISQAGKGAAGRDLLLDKLGDRTMPCLKECLFDALEIANQCGTQPSGFHVRRCVREASSAGLAAEYLRQFRNQLVHGDISKPERADWGVTPKYDADAAPHIRQFVANTRLALLLIQLLMRDVAVLDPTESSWSPRVLLPNALTTMHCVAPEEGDLLPFEELALEEEWVCGRSENRNSAGADRSRGIA